MIIIFFLIQDTEVSFCESEALSSELRLSEGEVLLPKVKTVVPISFSEWKTCVKEGSASEGEITFGGSSGERPRRDAGLIFLTQILFHSNSF